MTARGLAARTARLRIEVTGAVQGVGFRPFVYREAKARGLGGFVTNTLQGVTIEVEGATEAIDGLVAAIGTAPPPNAAVAGIATEPMSRDGAVDFEIRDSALAGRRSAEVLPDFATCDECLAEIFDPADRRYRYPFTNCTNCGPRYSIIDDLPYDRSRTSMRAFPMCAACRAEYDDPTDRRFHAEPNACPDCGPQVAFRDASGSVLSARGDALFAAAEALRNGRIVAVKGVGGFHLMVDARDEVAVRRLRLRKHREEKPLAVMFASLEAVRGCAELSAAEAALIASHQRPIVLVRRRGERLAASVSPGNPLVGAMLAYSPLHHLLLAEVGFPVVATSGNRSDEPIVTDEVEALDRLAGIADFFLVHDRPISRPLDDSVARVVAGRPMILRRARGFAPSSIPCGVPPGILALGGHLKAAVALTTGAGIVLGQHLGDLETPEARDAYGRAISDIVRLHDTPARVVAHDLHPGYHATGAAVGFAAPGVGVQHHVAHIAACMAEHGLSPPLLGVAWDGTGHGSDGTVWGGEFIRVTAIGWERVAHLRPFRLPGGEAAIREPRRAAFGLLFAAFGRDALAMTGLAPVAAFTPAERETLTLMLERDINAPVTTSVGRLFDAVASLLDLQQGAGYEGRAAAQVEWASRDDAARRPYRFAICANGDRPIVVDWAPVLAGILADLRAGADTGAISAAFHAGLAVAIADIAALAGESTVVLGGGCFQNARLVEAAAAELGRSGVSLFWPERVPPNDGGLALGQAFWAARTVGGG